MFHSERHAIMRIQRLPVHVQQVFWTASTRQEERVTSKAWQRIAVAAIRRQANTQALGRDGGPICVAVCTGCASMSIALIRGV